MNSPPAPVCQCGSRQVELVPSAASRAGGFAFVGLWLLAIVVLFLKEREVWAAAMGVWCMLAARIAWNRLGRLRCVSCHGTKLDIDPRLASELGEVERQKCKACGYDGAGMQRTGTVSVFVALFFVTAGLGLSWWNCFEHGAPEIWGIALAAAGAGLAGLVVDRGSAVVCASCGSS